MYIDCVLYTCIFIVKIGAMFMYIDGVYMGAIHMYLSGVQEC